MPGMATSISNNISRLTRKNHTDSHIKSINAPAKREGLIPPQLSRLDSAARSPTRERFHSRPQTRAAESLSPGRDPPCSFPFLNTYAHRLHSSAILDSPMQIGPTENSRRFLGNRSSKRKKAADLTSACRSAGTTRTPVKEIRPNKR